MPPKKRGGRSIGNVKAKLGTRVRKNQNPPPNLLPVISFDIRTAAAPGPSSTITRKVTTAYNEMQIKLSTEVVDSDAVSGALLPADVPKNLRITRNNCAKGPPKKESAADCITTSDSVLNVQPVKVTSQQQNKDGPTTRKRKLIENNPNESDDSCEAAKRRSDNNRLLKINKVKIRKEPTCKNKKRGNNSKKSPSVVAEAGGAGPPAACPRTVTEVRNKDSFKFEVTISGPPAPPGSRGPRATSLSDCSSWTREISSSSTVTCLTVRTDDIVRIDNKLPLLRLADVARAGPHAAAADARCPPPSGAGSSSSGAESGDRAPGCGLPDDDDDDDDDIDKALEKLTTEFKRKDVELVDSVACVHADDGAALRNFRKQVCKVLAEESEVIAHCDALKKLLMRDYEELMSDIEPCIKLEDDRPSGGAFGKPCEVRKLPRGDVAGLRKVCDETEATGRPEEPAGGAAPDCGVLGDERANDDDDALSLFAESITGLDSSRRHDSLPPPDNSLLGDAGEYVPQPVNANNKCETVPHRPSHVSKRNAADPQSQVVKIVCEKQNADSTSIYRACDTGGDYETPRRWSAGPAAPPPPHAPGVAGQPVFVANIYPEPKRFKSTVFLGVCFYNLALKCKRERCQFPHVELAAGVVSARLRRLDSDARFVHEYMAMRTWAALRRRYGLVFVLEGARRGLAALLLEMAIDFTRKASPAHPEDKALTVKVSEVILLYLNTIDVREFGQFLSFPATDGRLLCDIFMETLASTQNFSRFKSVFVNLTEFMDRIQRPFEVEVASTLLERVCILPHEARTAAAMLIVLRRTSPRVLGNGMIDLFERRLAPDEHLTRELQTLKRVAAGAGARSFSPDTTAGAGPTSGWASAVAAATNAIDAQLEPFRKLDVAGRPGRERFTRPAGAAPPPPLLRPPRPLFQFPRIRPSYHKRFVQDR